MAFYQLEELIRRGIVPLKSESDLRNGYLDTTTIDWIPGMKKVRLRDLPSFVRTTDPNETQLNFCMAETKNASKASAILVNTFDDLEQPILSALVFLLPPPIFSVGPLSLLERRYNVPTSTPTVINVGLSSFWKEDDADGLEWLEGKKPESVIYVNFGSITVMGKEHLLEFAWGLANSNYNFFWAIRPDLLENNKEKEKPSEGGSLLPHDLLEEIENRGFLCIWCKQEIVLDHPAIGGYLTHCGWNSIMESVGSGVPTICFSFSGDQPTNCHYICREWGNGIEIIVDEEGAGTREDVEKLVKEVMSSSSSVGRSIREKAREWQERARRATSPGGASFKNLDKAIDYSQ